MGKITFILGGSRSGKSKYAVKLAKGYGKRVAFIATCEGRDREMKKRIRMHKILRPAHWKTYEEPKDLISLLGKIGLKFEVIIIDCLTLLVSNLLLENPEQRIVEKKISQTLSIFKKIRPQSIIVSNEVGLGIVPQNKLARDFRDIAGRTNQLVAAKADKVFFMLSGIPWRIK